MDNSKAAQVIRKMLGQEDRELQLDELEGVAGGVMTKDEEGMLRDGLGLAKMFRMGVDDVLALVPTYYEQLHDEHPNVTQEEVITFIKNNY